jgi:hypothetical protein
LSGRCRLIRPVLRRLFHKLCKSILHVHNNTRSPCFSGLKCSVAAKTPKHLFQCSVNGIPLLAPHIISLVTSPLHTCDIDP